MPQLINVIFDIVKRTPLSLHGWKCVIALDSMIAVEAIFDVSAKVAAAVRVCKFVSCSNGPVVTPVAIVTEHGVSADSAAVAATSDKVAVDVLDSVAVAVKAVDPQSLVIGDDSVENSNVGKTRSMLSATRRSTLSSKVKVTEVSTSCCADVNGFPNSMALSVNAGATTAVDVTIGVAAMSVRAANVTAALRELRSAP